MCVCVCVCVCLCVGGVCVWGGGVSSSICLHFSDSASLDEHTSHRAEEWTMVSNLTCSLICKKLKLRILS